MLQKILIDKTRYIILDTVLNTATVVIPQKVQETIEAAQARLSAIPQSPTDEELLAFARKNYPSLDYTAEKADLEKTIAENSQLLSIK